MGIFDNNEINGLTYPEINLIVKALNFAARKHRDQRRKDVLASPYINHPIQLMHVLVSEAQVLNVGAIVGAILHDTIEDTHTTADEITGHFGRDIADIVLEVTDDKALSKRERKQAQIDHAPHLSYEAKLVKFADKICNLRDMMNHPPANWDLKRRQEYFDWAKSVIDQMRGTHTRLEQLFDAIYVCRPADEV